jgi:hypothetical protein
MAGPESTRNSFFPKGAIAFFATMILVYAGLWALMYALMAARG